MKDEFMQVVDVYSIDKHQRKEIRKRAESVLKRRPSYSEDVFRLLAFYLHAAKHAVEKCSDEQNEVRMASVFFADYDKYLVDHELYWKLFRIMLTYTNITRFEKQIRKSLGLYGRITETTLLERQTMSMKPRAMYNDDEWENEQKILGAIKERSGLMTCYRGFFIKGDANIRKDRKYTNKRQIEGAGMSYSMDPAVAIWFAFRSVDLHGKPGGGRSKRNNNELDEFQQFFETYYEKGTPVLGEFQVNPQDVILSPYFDRDESEVIAFPEQVLLKDYKLLSSMHFHRASLALGKVKFEEDAAIEQSETK